MSVKKILNQVIGLVLIISILVPGLSAAEKKAKNIIFMVPDGMGLADITAVRIYKYGIGKGRLFIEKLEHVGYQSNFAANSIVTDSAAAASAWACGQKFNNGEISCHGESGEFPPTILELAKAQGKTAGLVATSTITHATPAAFGAHVKSRRGETEIAQQYIQKTNVDVILGGGKKMFSPSNNAEGEPAVDLIAEAKARGYTFVESRDKLLKVQNPQKLLGLFNDEALTPVYKKAADVSINRINSKEPSLSEMTQVALKVLEKNEEGFFLLVEGSQVDWGNHQHNIDYMFWELLEFDNAVGVVLDWIQAQPDRKDETLLIVVPDHETGGFAINGPYGSTFTEPGQKITDGWTTENHTGVDTIIWSQGPYSQYLGKAIDNTDVFHIMKAALLGEGAPRRGEPK